jgi:hypothetical protein
MLNGWLMASEQRVNAAMSEITARRQHFAGTNRRPSRVHPPVAIIDS